MKLVSCICTALFCHNVIASALSLTPPPTSEKHISKSEHYGNSDQENINDDIFLSGGRFFKILQMFCSKSPNQHIIHYTLHCIIID